MNGLVSVIIPAYNRSAWIEEAVHSVRAQTWPEWEIILCDDGSDSDAAAALDRLVELDSERIRILHLPHRGPGLAREAGRQAARGAFIQYLDSDDRLAPEKFEQQIAALRAHPECGIAYGRSRLIDPDGTVLQESYKNIQLREALFPGLLVDRWWCTHTPLYRRELCDRIGPWSDLRYSQDWEYDARAGALGVELAYVDAVVSEHRTHRDPVRQTGRGRWLVPEQQVHFFQSLYRCAQQAGVDFPQPEMRHFVRWVFSAARSAGRAGDPDSAKKIFDLAKMANGGLSADMKFFLFAVRVFGWRGAAVLGEGLRRIAGRKPGGHTLPQSWMKEAHGE